MNEIEKMLSLMPQSDAVRDVPDERDYEFDEVFGAAGFFPKRVIYSNTKAQNQNIKRDPSTSYACVFYSSTHIVNEENYLEYSSNDSLDIYKEIDAFDISKIAVDKKMLDVKAGALMQDGPRLVMQLGHISGYTKVNTLEEVKRALAMKQLVQFGTKKVDWKKTFENKDNIIVPGTCYGHLMCFEGFDDELHGGCLVIRNSMGEFGKFRGRQFLKYEDFDILFISKYAFVDKLNEDVILNFQKKKRLELAHQRGCWNGQRPNDLATRYEASRMAIRMGAFYQTNTPELNIWNGRDKNANVTIGEIKTMFQNATKRKFSFELGPNNMNITRSDLAALSSRI